MASNKKNEQKEKLTEKNLKSSEAVVHCSFTTYLFWEFQKIPQQLS